jgi:hypothetical protein
MKGNDVFGRKKRSPAEELRDTLFGDMPLNAWPADDEPATEVPWSLFVQARADLEAGRLPDAARNWMNVLEQPGLETRHYLQAWHFLKDVGVTPSGAEGNPVLGVVVEVALHEGLDVLAAYDDRTARYYNYSGAGVVWDRPDNSLDAQIDALIAASNDVVAQIGPWDGERPPAPPRGHMRLSFLTPARLHFGQGPAEALFGDQIAGHVLQLAIVLMDDLIQRASAA